MSEAERAMRILLAEDNPSNADLIRTHLGDGNGRYELQQVSRMEDVLGLLQKVDVDVLLLDLDIGGCSRLEALERVEPNSTDVPVVVLSSVNDEKLAMASIEAGAQDFLCKGEISAVSLRRTLSYAISRNRRVKVGTFEGTLHNYDGLTSSGAVTSVTQDLVGQAPLQKRALEQFTDLVSLYRRVVESEVEAKNGASIAPSNLRQKIAAQVGNLLGGPRDLVDVHVETLRDIAHGVSHAKASSFAEETQMLPLEMMSLLVDYYRLGSQGSSQGRMS